MFPVTGVAESKEKEDFILAKGPWPYLGPSPDVHEGSTEGCRISSILNKRNKQLQIK